MRSTTSFLVHVIHDLVLPRDILHLNLVFVRTCPRYFLCVGVSRREAVILHGTSCAILSLISFVFTSNAYSVLGLVLRLILLVLVSVPCCLLDFVTVSDCMHQLVLVD